MKRTAILCLMLAMTFAGLGTMRAQQPADNAEKPQTAAPEAEITLAPMKKAATVQQIQEYLRLSGDVEIYRERWIALVDAKRSEGKPYWPDAFWTSVEDEMRKTDLTPSFVMIFQHAVSKKLMKQLLGACRKHTVEECRLTPEYAELYQAEQAVNADVDRMQRARTNEIIRRVFATYKPQIEAARARYAADHPDWRGQ